MRRRGLGITIAAYSAFLVTLIALWIRHLFGLPDLMAEISRRDFLGPFIGASAACAGQVKHLYDVAVQRALMDAALAPLSRSALVPFVFPAYVALLLRPLGCLSYATAYFAWMAVNILLALWMAVRLASHFASSRQEWAATLITVLASPPLLLTIWQGQLSLPVAAGLTEAIIALHTGRTARAGLWLALGLVKPQLIALPFLALVAAGYWKACTRFLLAASALMVSSWVLAGAWLAPYLRFLKEYPQLGRALALSYPTVMQNWLGALVTLFRAHQSPLAQRIAAALAVVSVLAALWLCRSRDAFWARFAVAIVLGVLACPHLYMHDVVCALPAGVALWSKFRSGPPLRTRAIHYVGVLLALEPAVAFAGILQLGNGFLPIQWLPWYLALVSVLAIRLLQPEATLDGTPGGPASRLIA